MAAGQGFKTFTTGEVLTAGDVNGYLMQGINVFATTTARDTAITAPAEGQFAFTKDTNSLWYYDGAAWVASGATGDIEGVTAGVGISGGGTSGTVTVTNSMATAIDAKGDLVPGTGADTFARLAVGANATVLTADSTQATGLKWAAPAASGTTISLLASQALTGLNTTTFSGISGKSWLYLVVLNASNTSNADDDYVKINASAVGANYNFQLSQTNGSGGLTKIQTTSNTGGFQITNSCTAGNLNSFSIWLNGCSGTSYKTGQITALYTSSGSFQRIGSAQYLDTTTVTSVTLYRTGGDLYTGGTAYLYGG